MNYRFDSSGKLICSNCNCPIERSNQDRHSCYWIELENFPIGMLAMIIKGQISSYNLMEKRIALSIWNRVKDKEKPKKTIFIKTFGASNIEIYNNWVRFGDEIFNSL